MSGAGSRWLTWINRSIGAVLLVVLAVVYWFAWRPLPQRSGTVAVGISRPVTVSFDRLGEPHIRAATLDDALFVQGYVTAQDRLFQMEGLRRLAAGELAEIIGPGGLENDREARRLGMRRIAEAAYLKLPPQDRAALAAYTRGVDEFVATHRNALPVEFTLLGLQPRPWSAVDSILVALQMTRNLTTTWRNDLIKRDMMREGNPEKVAALFPVRAGNEVQPGSNAWAIAGSHTASGKPLLSNDMHLEYSLPGIWYMLHLEAPGLNVAGVSLPGTPGIIAGHNDHIAWGFTNLQFDVQDLYIEKLDERKGRYPYRGQVEQAKPQVETIRVKGRSPAEMVVWLTRHGPLFVTEGQDRMTLRWSAADPGIFQYPILEFDRAQNWQQFTAAMERFPGPGQNVVYADSEGNIGYHAVGKLPIRRGFRGDLPVDGSSGDFEWEGYIPFDQLPSAFNPSRGLIVSANQDPFPPNYSFPVNGNFAPPGRSRQILNLLSAHNGWRAEQLLSVQADIYSAWLHFLARQVLAAYDKRGARNPALDPAVGLLRSWNGQMRRDWAAPFLISLVYQYVRNAVAESAAPGTSMVYDFSMAPAAVEQLLRTRPAGWFHDYDEMLLSALVDAVEEATRIQGRDLKRWQYGSYWSVTINNPVLHQLPLLGPYFDLGRIPMSGSASTVKQTTRTLAPSMRMDADTADWDRSLLNVTTGQSGQILSRHYRDQWPDYYNGRSDPMQFQNVSVESTLVFRPAP